jgi:hypothetical protein
MTDRNPLLRSIHFVGLTVRRHPPEELVVQNASQIDGAAVVFARSLRLGPGGGLLGYCGHGPVVSAANRVPCPLASAIEATSSMPVAKVGVAD